MEGIGGSIWSRVGFIDEIADLHRFNEEQDPEADPH
jgi:hypothetical protein